MNKNMKKLIVIVLTVILLSICTYSFADVGSFDRYDSGGWSSSDWSSSSGWDSDYSYSSSGDGELLWFLIGFFLRNPGPGSFMLLVVVGIIIYLKRKGKLHGINNSQRPLYNPNASTNLANVSPERSAVIANDIRKVDPLFEQEIFLPFVRETFVKLQNAWTARDWEPMRLLETPELFEQHKKQLQGYIDTNRINVMDRIAVNYAYLYKFRQDSDKDVIEVVLKSTMKDYIIDATTQEVLEGNKNQDRHTVYKLTFERKKGVLTQEAEEMKTTNCPNCGAPTKITSSGKCEYCGSVILIGDHGWVLANLEPFRE